MTTPGAISGATTLFDKLWSEHAVCELDNGETLLYLDRVFLHERTGSIALQSLHAAGYGVRDARKVFCTMDHIVDTFPGRGDATLMPSGTDFITATRNETRAANIRLFDVDDPNQGIVHVISPEQGLVLPGLTLVCPDSHTCTQGAIGALAWGIGSSEAEHAMATGTLRVRKPKNMRVVIDGALQPGVTAKDLVLNLIARFGANGGAGYAVEFAGSTVRDLEVEARFTLCNMAVEFSAFTAVIAPDEKVEAYFHGRDFAPKGEHWRDAVEHWRSLRSDEAARFDRELHVDASTIQPAVTWGTSPEQVVSISEPIPYPDTFAEDHRRESAVRALAYQNLAPGNHLVDISIDAAFIGSCTNSRLSDLQAAAAVVKGRRIAPGVRGVVVPGSRRVKKAAEQEGLDQIFIDAGFEWRDSGCSMCFYAGGETFGAHQRVISTTNRNFEGRQGPNTRTHLASPATVAASAIAGSFISAEMLAESESLAS
ncbi:3-isopropylmalate dehydratase large subunit [Microbulbifer agarilyticus]|uniref:3-isopropylmalate dehydratase large subunit n=1 Tax=Microbulbifer agarilyticus TaxID=260552 RepID=UPI001CD5E72A|nr:3-isopropylmalate dehydratase large subunit [Microbulbifer agarilyticus]MCA0900829.1 3-isopropylmalate dehydratase large subunit [Microbulbifer agarilyticus]